MVLRIYLILSVLLVTFLATKVQYLNCYKGKVCIQYISPFFSQIFFLELGLQVAKVDHFQRLIYSNGHVLRSYSPIGQYGPVGRNGPNAKNRYKVQLRKDFFGDPCELQLMEWLGSTPILGQIM